MVLNTPPCFFNKHGRGIELYDLPFPQDQHPIIVKHSVEPMRDSEHNCPLEFLADRALDLKKRTLSLAHAYVCAHRSRTSSSSSTSICEVASSIMMTLVRLRIALAKATSCLSPALNEPPLSMGISKMLEVVLCLRSRRSVR
jgi:hypothetical protein